MRATGEPFCLLDKDTLYGGYSAAAMGALTGDPNDRDSPLFLQHLRDPEYRALIDTARENLELGVSVRGGRAALARSARRAALRPRMARHRRYRDDPRRLGAGDGGCRRMQRIVARGNPNDAYKLAHWDEYRQRRFVPGGDQCRDSADVRQLGAVERSVRRTIARLVSP